MHSWLGGVAIDAAAVLLFATAGRQSHDESSGPGTILTIAAPFLVALSIGWLATPGARLRPVSARTGVGVWAATVVIGLVLRRTAWDRGTASSFAIVTALVLAALMIGWRALWSLGTRRTVRSSSQPSRDGR